MNETQNLNNMNKDNKNTEPENLDKKLHITDSFYDMLINKLMNGYNYYLDIQVCCNEKESEKYQDRAEEIYSIIEWCEKNYRSCSYNAEDMAQAWSESYHKKVDKINGNELLEELMGIYAPSFNKCLIAVTFDGSAFLIKTENSLEEAFDSSDLEYILTDVKQIPKEPGIYKCVIRYQYFKCNIPIDPEEWDCKVTIESCELVDISF